MPRLRGAANQILMKFLMPINSPKPLLAPGGKYSAVCGTLLLLLWIGFWIESFGRGQLVLLSYMAFPAWSFLGLDFMHNYLGARAWMSGLNPYLHDIGDDRGQYAYPPVVLPMFAWCKFFSLELATILWGAIVAATIAWGARLVQQVRVAASLPFVSLVLLTVTVVWSMPALFAMERGNSDAIVLLAMIGAFAAWRRKRSLLNDMVIGGCFALAGWVKVYPVVLFGLLVLTGRWRALLLGLGIFATVGLVPLEYTKAFLDASRHAQGQRTDTVGVALDWLTGQPMRAIRADHPSIESSSHSLTSYWPRLWLDLGIQSLSRIPGLIAAAVCLFPVGAWVTWHFWRSPTREQWVFPFMLWLVTLTTFWMPVSYDYNLFFLPLAMWAVWDHRDGWVSNLAVGAAILWWQPLELPAPLNAHVLFFAKLTSLIVAGHTLVWRLAEERPAPDDAAEAAPTTGALEPS